MMCIRVHGCKRTELMLRGQCHIWIDRGSWGRTIGSPSWARVVLRSTPGETDTGISDRVALHLVDGHLCGMALDELDKPTAFARWDLDIGDFAKALEEGTEFVLRHVATQSTNKDGGIIWIRELIHGLWTPVVSER